MEQKRETVPGYRAGCEDQSDVASTSLSTSISCISVPSSEQNVNEFVIIPYGPTFYIGQTLEIDHVTNEFKTQTMSRLTQMEYCWKEEGEAAYEAPYWEYLNLIICVTSPPVPTPNMSTTRVTSTFSEADIEAAEMAYKNWRNNCESSRKCKNVDLY